MVTRPLTQTYKDGLRHIIRNEPVQDDDPLWEFGYVNALCGVIVQVRGAVHGGIVTCLSCLTETG